VTVSVFGSNVNCCATMRDPRGEPAVARTDCSAVNRGSRVATVIPSFPGWLPAWTQRCRRGLKTTRRFSLSARWAQPGQGRIPMSVVARLSTSPNPISLSATKPGKRTVWVARLGWRGRATGSAMDSPVRDSAVIEGRHPADEEGELLRHVDAREVLFGHVGLPTGEGEDDVDDSPRSA
jgi:hypothetical protein